MAAPPEVVRRRRRWPRRLLIATNVFLALCVVTAGGGYLYLRYSFGKIQTHHFLEGILHNNGDDDPGEPMNVLLVGSDTRANLKGADCKRNCRDENGNLVTGQRSDTIMILHADPRQKQGSILSIPRDLWVKIPGLRTQRINAAFEKGPDLLVRTVTESLGIPIDHYVEVDFVGFRNLVNAVNGVPIYVPAPARDRFSDLRIPEPGCITLNGDQALGWVRSRHYQYRESGRWRSDPRSDFGRILRQQDFIRRLMKRSISKGIHNPFTLNRLISIATKNLTIDSAMSSRDILRLGKQFRSVDPSAVSMMTLPVYQTHVGAAEVLKLKQPDAQSMITTFNGQAAGAPAGEQPAVSIPPSSIRVRTLNGSGVNGAASRAARELQAFGFQNTGTGDADKFSYGETVLRYGKGQRDKALALQSYLKGVGRLVEDPTLSVDVVFVVGRDFGGVARPAATPTPPGPTQSTAPSTTAAPPVPVPIPEGAPPQPQC